MTTPYVPRSRFWADLVSSDFGRLDPDCTVAVLPVAAVEQHGPHLPLSVDLTLVDGLIGAALPNLPASLPVLFLPTQQVGYSPEHAGFAGTLTLSAATLTSTWIELGQCVAAAGIKKLLLLNSHGGQVSLMDIVARELRGRAKMIVHGCSWWNLPLGDEVTGLFSPQEHRFGVHAGEIETSLMLALAEQHVRMEQARDFESSAQHRAQRYRILGNGSSAKFGWHMQDYNSEGAVGNAAAASAAKGAKVLEAAARELALLLQELSDLPLSTLVDQPGG